MHTMWNNKGMRWAGGLARGTAVAAALTMSSVAWAVPSQVTLEGTLTSSGGGPAPDGSYNVAFSLYKDASGGNPVWAEGPVLLAVKNGLFQYAVGTKVALTPAKLAGLPTAFLGMKVEADAELPRQQLLSTAFALRAGVAEDVECSGCIAAAALDPNALAAYAKAADLGAYAKTADLGAYAKAVDLSAYAKTASLKAVATSGAYADLSGMPVLAAVATSGKYADLTGGPDLTPYAKTASLKAVATSGAYSDLAGAPVLAKVATSGSYVDLSNQPVAAKLGAACGTGLVMKGIKADGSYDCTPAGDGPVDVKNLPLDGIDEISNGLIFNQFNDTFSGSVGAKIPDNNPDGVTDTINYPDIGLSQKLTVTVDVSNSNIAGLTLTLVDPKGTTYVLYAKGGAGVAVKTSYPLPTAPVSGDLTTWVGQNPKGPWKLTVVDGIFLNNTFDGAINAWSITSQTVSNKKVQVKGDLHVDGNVQAATLNGYTATSLTGGQTYMNWGAQTCGAGWSPVSTGAAAMMVERSTWGQAGDVLCLEGSLANDQGTGVEWSYKSSCSHYQNSAIGCAVCAPNQGPGRPAGQCFTRWGNNACPAGWNLMVDGYITTALEWQSWGRQGGTVCMAKSVLTNCSGNGGVGATWAAYQTDNFEAPRACGVCCR